MSFSFSLFATTNFNQTRCSVVMKETTSVSIIGALGVLTRSWPRYCLHGLMDTIPMKRKRISPIQDALYWCRAKRDKDGFVIKFINNFIAKDLELHAELRYSYGEGLSLPWIQEVNVVKIEVANSLEVLNNFNTTEKM
ncbi:hypothetical protein KUTeg_013110 [Tegillarca granosa]|uniref:Uncharacterized protein n=1 Tax=Tegillarca granosa TaxID=220873 RepID=A0ABQ9EV62_TEGGR|nr:hypothetical protein KUTeg_013110 [Tegillarca granosa]